MKMTQIFVAVALTASCVTASAWWGGNPWNGNGFGNGLGDGSGDFSMNFSGRSNMYGRGNGYGYNAPYYGYGYPYGPAVPPHAYLSEEQQAAMQARHQAMLEAMEAQRQQFQQPAPGQPAYAYPMTPFNADESDMNARREAMLKQREAQRTEMQKQREERFAEMQKQMEARRAEVQKQMEAQHEAMHQAMQERRAKQQ